MVNFAAAVAYHFCLTLFAAFTQPGDHLLAELCKAALLKTHAMAFLHVSELGGERDAATLPFGNEYRGKLLIEF